MGNSLEDRFVVYVRAEPTCTERPDTREEPYLLCGSYEEARRVQRSLHQASRECVIRYVGESGGGD
jgi:hypothetical protein